jgi:hypothetical protein
MGAAAISQHWSQLILLASARFPQKKVLEDELAIAGRKRCTASLTI